MPDFATSIRRASPLLKASLGVHAASLAALAVDPSLGLPVAATLIGNHALLGVAGLHMKGSWLGPNATRFSTAASEVALTFDDGPDPDVTPRVLDMLAAAGQRATFFCIGTKAEQHPAIVRAVHERGHGVENHTYRHLNSFSLVGPTTMRREVARNQSVLADLTGQAPSCFRAPAGIQNPWLSNILADEGLRLVSWTRRGLDTISDDAQRVTARLVGHGLRAGDILLLHDRRAGGNPEEPVVLRSLPMLLHALTQAGLRSVPLGPALATPAAPGTR